MASSPSPSSSAVTIPTPGKSILKKPPPPQQSFFSLARLSKLLPSQSQSQSQPASSIVEDEKTLKRAHFILPQLVTVYPISSQNPPSTPSLREEKRTIEQRETERRRRIIRGNSFGPDSAETEDWWSLDRVEAFYRECCEGREEVPIPTVSAAFKKAANTNPRSLDLSGVQLNLVTAAILSDVFTIEWGLRKLVFKECDLDEHILKPILHALLIPQTLTFLCVALNRRLKPAAFRLIGAYVAKAKSLQYLDVSQNILDKKSIEYIAAALPTVPNPGLESLKLDDCSLRPAALEALAHVVRTSNLKHISLRHNRISASGAVALALMIKDYPDAVAAISTPTSNASSPTAMSPVSSVSSIISPPATPTSSSISLPSTTTSPNMPIPRSGPLPPPPRHPTVNPSGPQTTYTPYVPRSRRAGGNAPAINTNVLRDKDGNPLSATGEPVPLITSSSQGGVTTRHPVAGNGQQRHGPSAALLDKVRALDALPRLGALTTLDLRGNDVRGGVNYIAQVLKRNRTLKVLNLSENKLDVQCLTVIAEALKYNSCLETLDLNKNPCCGPGLEGIQSLRTAFTLNIALKRLFLSSTGMTSAGAIALAEFLPESQSLLHLDLTVNNLNLAGVMALSSGLKANHTMRCLDLNIPPGDEEMARMCRDILNSCIRNTEEAERSSIASAAYSGSGRGLGKGVWGLIEESELAKMIRKDEEKKVGSDLLVRAYGCKAELEEQLARLPSSSSSAELADVDGEVIKKVKNIMRPLATLVEATVDPTRLDELLGLNDSLMTLLRRTPSGKEALQEIGLITEVPSPRQSGKDVSITIPNGHVSENGHADEDEVLATPKIDKGKGRAEPEPEEPEKILSPTKFLISESDDEDEDGEKYHDATEAQEFVAPSPTDRSRSWVAEEGEIFRKGNVLLGPEEMEGEYAGEELRRELLEVEVERPPPRPIIDEFGMEIPQPADGSVSEAPEEKKPSPRPYVSRRTSTSSSIISLKTQGLASPRPGSDSEASPAPVLSTASPASAVSPGHVPYLPRRSSAASIETR
ncbi:RNI-like protein [Neolentinus lepideus HHB14362 ss-1]|uniref:RNI-like protein n=1 Tax=Neolentinus lepideus HHB14362 ss-1 TaxID=1314782 RepID=A0A165SYA8_9AGAM|nr:RNI-like protein [Neolentinus lepideus HHB14362 ss-1]